ncbi:TrkH family potassium uptake protein [Phaeobacter sp. HF9A]|uniref:TrkH family potassium uptake protein n=1 Tax=Phaeobacter sp. HF9A TaxID=2721561 RepID=UPI001430E871|nr:potassium transporter TrkG [Phaeobacter sp. HF9A]NIZ14693.1 TrkH family potassium uptake protein [Phaeobacter sp. HF9A]
MARRRPRSQVRGVLRLPLLLLIWAIFALAMWVPAIHAALSKDHSTAQSFFYAGIVGLMIVTFIGLSLANRVPRYGMPGQLMTLLATFVFLPLFLAIPLQDALRNTSYLNAYFDMVSALTTTGADIFDRPGRLPDSVHLWRAQVAWLGGLFMWIAASAVLAPLSLGGFEVTTRAEPGRSDAVLLESHRPDPRRKLILVTKALAPVYFGLTLALAILLVLCGETGLVAACHAMSILATSGMSPIGGIGAAEAGIGGEMVMFLFLLFALSRLTFSSDTVAVGHRGLNKDPEFKTGILIIFGVTLLLFLRHWIAALEVSTSGDLLQGLASLWGAVFTIASFLTTNGFESAYWTSAQQWSGLETPGMILLGLAVMGGGVATTAGGVKLLRVYALYLNGLREMERLVLPSSVSGEGRGNRRLQSNGAFVAWIFFMLFALSLTLISVAFSAFGIPFEQAMILTVAGLSTTGPLIEAAGQVPIELGVMAAPVKLILCFAMVLGRLETLAIIALLSPNLWRR